MRFVKLVLSVSLVVLLLTSCIDEKENRFLHTQGQDIIDSDGNKIILRGVGLGNWLLPEGYMWKFGAEGDRPRKIEKIVSNLIGSEKADEFWKNFRKYYITEEDIKRISELGFNSVRPALNARLFLTEGDSSHFIEESFVLIDSLVNWCRKYGLYVIIDMHGAPGGQTGANIDDSAQDEPALFINEENQDKLVDLWLKIANRYYDEPTVAAYDLLNEPLPGHTGDAKKYGHLVEPLYKRLTESIRKVDKNHMITVEGINWSNDWSIFGKPFDENLIYQFHYYCWNRPDNLNDISQYLDYREKLSAPVWVGETGEKGATIYWSTTQYFEANNIGWSFWPWKKMDTQNTPYSIKPPENWDKITDYTHGKEKPKKEVAQKVFNELIENIKIENCDYYPDIVNSIFRRIPIKIEAENYGHNGINVSYWVTDTSQRAEYYRINEPVLIELIDFKEKQFLSEQYIVLNSKEWVSYTFNNSEPKSVKIVLKVMKKSEKARFDFMLNNYTKTEIITSDNWQEITFHLNGLNIEQNNIKFTVTEGTVFFDWINISR